MKRELAWTVVLLTAGAGAMMLGGCGGRDEPGGTSLAPMGKIHEYKGDGHHGAKPFPPLLGPATGQMQTQVAGTALRIGAVPLPGSIPSRNISWYRIPPVGALRRLLVTLQPTENADTDLYLLDGRGFTYDSGANSLGYSDRLVNPDTYQPFGYSPDWVFFEIPATNRWPTSQVAVYGMSGSPTPKHYRIECDPVWGLTVDGISKSGSLDYKDSHWYRFLAHSGTAYNVVMSASNNDPDLYVYKLDSSGFINEDVAVGGGTVAFTATVTGFHYVRIYGFGSSPNDYTVEVNAP